MRAPTTEHAMAQRRAYLSSVCGQLAFHGTQLSIDTHLADDGQHFLQRLLLLRIGVVVLVLERAPKAGISIDLKSSRQLTCTCPQPRTGKRRNPSARAMQPV